MDSDHVYPQKDLLLWLWNLARLASESADYQQRLAEALEATGKPFAEWFFRNNSRGPYKPSEEGAQALYANTNNLVLTNKVTNQQDKNDVSPKDFLETNLAHGKAFVNALPRGDRRQPAVP